ncbi:hypothetical protein [Nisaea nitritireducens]|uniref:hypothetical protein n=1 Tax=Nisaea nitritireducens TaxID=568392 RepID=UPI0018673BDE|nr:hypothetical protein [Nisaea nitritireducens]
MTVQQLTAKDRLKSMLSSGSRPLGGQLQFLGLDEVKQQLGDRWETKKDFIRSLCQRTVKPHIGKSDLCLEYGELGFVILFGELDDETATIKCGLIKAEILRQLKGDDELASLNVHTSVGDLASGGTSNASLSDLIEKAMANKSEKSADPRADDAPESMKGESHPAEAFDYSETQKENFHQAQWASIKSTLQPGADPFSLQEEEKNAGLGDVDFGFLPLVNLKSGVISIFHCAAVRLDSFDRIINGHDVLSENSDEKSAIELDLLTLARAKIGLMDMTMRKRIALVSIPLSYATLSRPRSRQDFLAALKTIPSELQRYLVITLTGFPDGVPTGTLAEYVHLIKNNVRGVAARVHPETNSLKSLKEAGVQIVGFKFPEAEPVSAKMAETMLTFKKNAGKFGLSTFVRNLKRKDLVRAAIDLEYDYFSGPAIADLSDYVGPVREVDLTAF